MDVANLVCLRLFVSSLSFSSLYIGESIEPCPIFDVLLIVLNFYAGAGSWSTTLWRIFVIESKGDTKPPIIAGDIMPNFTGFALRVKD